MYVRFLKIEAEEANLCPQGRQHPQIVRGFRTIKRQKVRVPRRCTGGRQEEETNTLSPCFMARAVSSMLQALQCRCVETSGGRDYVFTNAATEVRKEIFPFPPVTDWEDGNPGGLTSPMRSSGLQTSPQGRDTLASQALVPADCPGF